MYFSRFSAQVAFLFSAGNVNGKMHYRNYVTDESNVRIRVKLVLLVCVWGGGEGLYFDRITECNK